MSNPPELPLPPRPDLEQYRKLAKELAAACAASAPDAIRDWAERWLASLARALGTPPSEATPARIARVALRLERFAVGKLRGGARECALADAQFVLARSHGFASWPKFAAHVDALAHTTTETAGFEAAVDAVVAGDEETLRHLLRAQPALVRARSAREHGATLLHYVAANGVEGYRQKTPANAVRIAEILLAAGADVDAEADLYGGRCTALGLAATSVHPARAGVQEALLQLLLDHGADVNRPDLAGNGHSTIFACLANGRPEAARYLAARGARMGLVEAAGVGRLDVVKTFFGAGGRRLPSTSEEGARTALLYACNYGYRAVVQFLLETGTDPSGGDAGGQTALHHAVMGGHLGVVELLLAHGAPLETRNEYGGTVLGQALWSAAHGGDPAAYVALLEALIAAGAKVPERHPPVNAAVDAVLARHGSVSDPERYWFGEEPARKR